MRCLRAITDERLTATVFLSKENYDTLDEELHKNFNMEIKDIKNPSILNIAQFFVYFETFEMRKIKKYIDFHLGTNRIFCAFFQICSFIV